MLYKIYKSKKIKIKKVSIDWYTKNKVYHLIDRNKNDEIIGIIKITKILSNYFTIFDILENYC